MNRYFPLSLPILLLACLQLISGLAASQEQSVRPGVNSHYQDPEWDQWVNAFERPGREVFDQRHVIVAAAGVKQGMDLADIGAGTGLFTRLFASRVGPEGTVYAVDISKTFVRNILRTSSEQGLSNVQGIVNTARDAALPERSIDLAFLSDTYHHFEYPQDMLASIRRALRDGGRLVIVDFRRHPGVSSRWVMGHVRADMNEVIGEVKAAGFRFLEEKPLLEINYFLEFEKRTTEQSP